MHDGARHDRDRVQRLRELAAKIERLPPSRARDQLLREAHHRTVVVDTGVPGMSRWGNDLQDDGIALFQHMALRSTYRSR
jgi:hypothetical protein